MLFVLLLLLLQLISLLLLLLLISLLLFVLLEFRSLLLQQPCRCCGADEGA